MKLTKSKPENVSEKKKAERESREYELRLASIINFLPDATLAIDREGKIIAWNRAMEDMTGAGAEEMLGKGNYEYALPFYGKRRPLLIDFIFSWDKEHEKLFSSISREGDILYKETTVPCVRGERRTLWGKASPLYDAEGKIVGAIESLRDVTDRNRSEEALRVSEEKYRTILEEMEEGYQEVDLAGNFTFFNESFRRIFGYTREELMGSSFRRYAAEEGIADQVYEAYNRMYRTGSPIKRLEWDILNKAGNRRTVEFSASLLRDSKGRRRGFRGIVRDVTERKTAEEFYRIIANSSPGGVYIIEDGRIHFVNPRIPMYSGYSEEELLGSRILNYVHPDDRESVRENARRMMRGEMASPYEYRIMDKSGKIKWLMETVVPISYRGRRAVLGNNMDITEQKEVEAEKDRLREQLIKAQKMEAIGTLAGGIAHDFNNILGGIQGHVSLMNLETELEPGHRYYERLKQIEDHVAMGSNLTRQLLGFARRGRYEMKSTNMNDVIEKTAAMFGRTKKEVLFCRNYENVPWIVEADRGQMEQVFMNLFVNAWQAMPGGGEITLTTENVLLNEDDARERLAEPGLYVKIAVTDTGTGMDEKTRARIFDPFFTTKGVGMGTGLGLSIVYGIIKGHGGFVHVDSTPGQGSTFSLFLPVSRKRSDEEKPVSEGLTKGTETILLVDDEPMVLGITRELLQCLGYQVLAVGDGQEAIAVYQERMDGIDLVLLDMILPGISGEQVFDHLQRMNPAVRVILSSGYSIEGQAQQIMERGCRGFLQKPFKVEQLSHKIREVLDS